MLELLLFLQTSESITVTATRTETRLADTPSSVVVLSKEAIATSPAATLDDALRQVPGFTLFRRSGSRVANPTTQGVSLRGIGASGASRAVVLDDGVPLNDPFGGWVYWGRVPRAALERIEVVRGGASELYGSGAMGGVVQFIRRRDAALIVEGSAGSQETGTASLFAAHGGFSIAGDFLTTAGYTLVDEAERGAVDRPADASHVALDATYRRDTAFVRASIYEEERNNGTPLQINDTSIRQLAAGWDRGSLLLRAFGSDQDYRQTFTAIAPDRSSERLTVDQRVPSRAWGGMAQVTRVIGTKHALLGGAEVREVRGTSEEDQFAFDGGMTHVENGGSQRMVSAFVEDIVAATDRLSITGGVRFDHWEGDTSFSPRLSVLWRAHDRLSLTASAYQAFRAPTLNELFRGFRVGNVITNPNPDLGPERLNAIELGARADRIRVTLFWMETDDAIANVTISQTPTLITRQRQNFGGSRSRGAEVEGEWLFSPRWRASAGWLFSDATLSTGKRVPQVPRHQVTAQLQFTGRTTVGAQARWSGVQFDDDLNELPLRSYFVADLFASYPLTPRFAITAAVENVFDREVEASATPVITLGQPRAVRIGFRFGR